MARGIADGWHENRYTTMQISVSGRASPMGDRFSYPEN